MRTQCVILAGGLGTRLGPLTATIPKALVHVGGEPFVDHQLRWLAAHGVDAVVFSVGHFGIQLREHVGDGRRFGLDVGYVDEGEKLRGTAGALRLALDENALDERFILTYGDSYLPVDFGAFARTFELSAAPAMMSVFRNEGRWDASNAAVREGRVTLYDKRRGEGAANMEYIDYGLLAFAREVIGARVPAGARADLAELLHDLSIEGQLAAYEVKTRFYEVGSREGLNDLENFLVR
jgi:NDP-sugar pyrophosphorylase family protein